MEQRVREMQVLPPNISLKVTNTVEQIQFREQTGAHVYPSWSAISVPYKAYEPAP